MTPAIPSSPPLLHLFLLLLVLANPQTLTNAHPLGERVHTLGSRAKEEEKDSASYGKYVFIALILAGESPFYTCLLVFTVVLCLQEVRLLTRQWLELGSGTGDVARRRGNWRYRQNGRNRQKPKEEAFTRIHQPILSLHSLHQEGGV